MDQYSDGVPPLGFEGEMYAGNSKRVLLIPTSKSGSDPRGWMGSRIEVYRWGGSLEGYNVFLPGHNPISVKTPFDAKMMIQSFFDGNLLFSNLRG